MRDERIDILRFIGLAMIIFAHVEPPGILFQLRNFDVPLMVLVSGMSFAISYRSDEPFFEYVWKRAKRLIFPVWIFLTLYFISIAVFDSSSDDLQTKTILTSYALLGGIGYVWIIRVFILVALVSPFIYSYHKKEKSNSKYLIMLASISIIFEIIRYFSLPYLENTAIKLITHCTHYILPYSIIFALGLRLSSLKATTTKIISSILLLTFILIFGWLYSTQGKIIPTQEFKYPPSIYYFSYAIFISLLLWQLSNSIDKVIIKLKIKPLVLFIAQNSIWIYLWHIPFIKYFEFNFIIKYLITFSAAVLITSIQMKIVKKLLLKVTNTSVQKNIKMVLTG
jgi:fucose 4-O-acetylase-like acetyltransferase